LKRATPLLTALGEDAEVINIEVVHFLISVGARVKDLDDPAFNSCAKALIQEEVQKLEVPTLLLYLFLSVFYPWTTLHAPSFLPQGGSYRARDA
jgi:hypothetical protein